MVADFLAGIKESGLSEYNDHIAKLMSVRRLLDEANMYSRSASLASYDAWMRCLHSVERELWSLMTDADKERCIRRRVNVIPPRTPDPHRLMLIVYPQLDGYQKFLEEIKASKGLSFKQKDDAHHAVLN